MIGTPLNDDDGSNSGSSYVFELSEDLWSQTQKLISNDGTTGDKFGYSVSLSGDKALIGSRFGDDNSINSGSAYVFDLLSGDWSQTEKFSTPDSAAGDNFGVSVSLGDERALIGARFDNENGSNSGSAYVFELISGRWSLSEKLIATDGAADDNFGISVSLSGDRALIGAYRNDDNGNDSGSAYIFDLTAGSWSQTQKLAATDGTNTDYFGYSVSLSGDRALIGAYRDAANSGSAYVFDLTSGFWSLSQKIISPDSTSGDNFGWSVSLNGDRALIGTRRVDDINSNNSGSAYQFDLMDGLWLQIQKITAEDGRQFDKFGSSVSLFADKVLIGALDVDERDTNAGSAYVFYIIPDHNIAVTVTGLELTNSIEVTTNGQSLNFIGPSVATSFTTPINENVAYGVEITANPSSPEQVCSVTGGNSGMNDGSGIMTITGVAIEVNCVTTLIFRNGFE